MNDIAQFWYSDSEINKRPVLTRLIQHPPHCKSEFMIFFHWKICWFEPQRTTFFHNFKCILTLTKEEPWWTMSHFNTQEVFKMG